jgi:hypothetical protein
MRKLLFGAVATTIVALQPMLALAQNQPGSGKEPAGAQLPVTQTFSVNVLQTIAVSATSLALPLPSSATITQPTRCFVGAAGGGITQGTFEPIRFVGNILCIDPGPNGDFASFVQNCPAGQTPVVQGVKLIKTEPLIPKCPDVYPGGTFVLYPANTGIRTWFPLKHTPCETNYRLEIEFACVGPDPRAGGVRVVRQARVNVFNFTVKITADTLSWVVHALHNEPLGVCEVPCITDEAFFQLLINQSNNIRVATAGLPGTVRLLNTALDVMEATVVNRCLFLTSVAQVTTVGSTLVVNPCILFGTAGLWGNFTVADFGWGIVDTLENPCCCKLISDLYWLKLGLIGNDP